MTTLATIMQWLITCLSTGPLLLALVMLTMLRAGAADEPAKRKISAGMSPLPPRRR